VSFEKNPNQRKPVRASRSSCEKGRNQVDTNKIEKTKFWGEAATEGGGLNLFFEKREHGVSGGRREGHGTSLSSHRRNLYSGKMGRFVSNEL